MQIGGKVFTTDSLVEYLTRMRKITTSSGGAEMLVRFFDDKAETVPLPYPYSTIPLEGLSFVPAARMVLSILHTADRASGGFTAVAAFPDRTPVVVAGSTDGPLAVVADGISQALLMYMLMGKLASGNPDPANLCPSISEWLSRVAAKRVADDFDDSEFKDGPASALRADEIVRESLTDLAAVLKRAQGQPLSLRTKANSWTTLLDMASWLGGLRWDDLRDKEFAVARGYSADMGVWWTVRGLVGREFLLLPEIRDSLIQLASTHPVAAEHVDRALDRFAEAVSEGSIDPAARVHTCWRVEDAGKLVRFIRKEVANTANPKGMSLIAYRRHDGQLRRISRQDGGEEGIDLTSIQTAGPADGVLILTSSADGAWRAYALDREGEHGSAASHHLASDRELFTPIVDGELLGMLGRILTGRAQIEPSCTPYEWAYRRVLYGLALTLETGRFDGEEDDQADSSTSESATPPAAATTDPPPLASLVDEMLSALIRRHVTTLVEAMRTGPRLSILEAEKASDEERWAVFAEVFGLLRGLTWTHLRVAPLAQAWEVEAEQAEWWGAEALGPLQARQIPDATESLMRCAFAIQRVPDQWSAFRQLTSRVRHVFGDDFPILWTFLPDQRA